MQKSTYLFHKISYLQYPLLAVAGYYVIQPYINGFGDLDQLLKDYQNVLVYMGLAISFSTLQDTSKTQNNFSKKVWENPKWAKRFIIYLTILMLTCLVLGVVGMYAAADSALEELAFGLIVFGIGMLGMLKTGIEMFAKHRKDKNPEKP